MIKHHISVKITTVYDDTAKSLLRQFVNMKDSKYADIQTLEYWSVKEPTDNELKKMVEEIPDEKE